MESEIRRIRNVKLMLSEARPENFFEKILKYGHKIHCLALKLYTGPPKCITGASKSVGQGGPGPRGPLDPLVYNVVVQRGPVLIIDLSRSNKQMTYQFKLLSFPSGYGKIL